MIVIYNSFELLVLKSTHLASLSQGLHTFLLVLNFSLEPNKIIPGGANGPREALWILLPYSENKNFCLLISKFPFFIHTHMKLHTNPTDSPTCSGNMVQTRELRSHFTLNLFFFYYSSFYVSFENN